MATALATGVAQAAASETMLNDVQLDGLLTGNTVYLAIPAGGPGGPNGGTAPFLYGADGRASARLPTGMTLVGRWRVDGDRYCVDWDNGPSNSCTRVVRSEGTISLVDAESGEPRGTVESIIPGNPEQL